MSVVGTRTVVWPTLEGCTLGKSVRMRRLTTNIEPTYLDDGRRSSDGSKGDDDEGPQVNHVWESNNEQEVGFWPCFIGGEREMFPSESLGGSETGPRPDRNGILSCDRGSAIRFRLTSTSSLILSLA